MLLIIFDLDLYDYSTYKVIRETNFVLISAWLFIKDSDGVVCQVKRCNYVIVGNSSRKDFFCSVIIYIGPDIGFRHLKNQDFISYLEIGLTFFS